MDNINGRGNDWNPARPLFVMGRTEKPIEPATEIDGDGVHPTVGSWHARFSPVWPHEPMWRKRASEDFRWSEGRVEAFGGMSYWARLKSWGGSKNDNTVKANLDEPAIIARDGDTGEIVWSYQLQGPVSGPTPSADFGSRAYFNWRNYGNGDYPGEYYYQDDRWSWVLLDLTVSSDRVLAIYRRILNVPWTSERVDFLDEVIVTLSRSTGRRIGVHRFTNPVYHAQPYSDEYPEEVRWYEYGHWDPNTLYDPNLPTISEGTRRRYEYALQRGLTNWGGIFINVDADGNHFLDQKRYGSATPGTQYTSWQKDRGVPLAGTDANVFRGAWKAAEYWRDLADLDWATIEQKEVYEEEARLSDQAWNFWKDFYENAEDVNPSYMGWDRHGNIVGMDKRHWHFANRQGYAGWPAYYLDLRYYAQGAHADTGDLHWTDELSGRRYGDIGEWFVGNWWERPTSAEHWERLWDPELNYDEDYVYGAVFKNMPGAWAEALESWHSGIEWLPHTSAADGDGNIFVIGEWLDGPDGKIYTRHSRHSHLTAEEFFQVKRPALVVYDSSGAVTIPKQHSIFDAQLVTVNPVTQNPVLLNRVDVGGSVPFALTEYEYNGDYISAVRSQWSFRIRADGNWLDLNETGDDGSYIGVWVDYNNRQRHTLDAIHFDRNGFMWASGGMRRRHDGEYRRLVAKIDWNGSGDIIEINDLREPHRDRSYTGPKRRWTGEKKDIEAYWKSDGEIPDSYPTDSEINEETGHSSYLSRNRPPETQGLWYYSPLTKIVTGLRPDSSFTRAFVSRYPAGRYHFGLSYHQDDKDFHFGVFCYDDFKESLGAPDTLDNYLRRDWHWDIDAPSMIFDIAGAPGEAGAIS